MKKRILFLCTGNSCRSQMAEGLLNSLYGNKYRACSAGTEPSRVNRNAIKVMAEIGIDITTYRSKSVREFQEMQFDYVVTVCDNAKKICPLFHGGNVYLHKSFDDPAVFHGTELEILKGFRRVRDEIKDWITQNFGEKKAL